MPNSENVTGKPRPAASHVDEHTLKADLEKYRRKAIELGATQAEVLPASWVQIDERVRLKCQVPPCYNYGRCMNCPPHCPDLDTSRKTLAKYQWAIIFKNDVPAEDFAVLANYYPNGQKWQKKSTEIASQLEGMAFADGYCYAVGFGSGSCRDTLCAGMHCSALDSGRCAHQLRSRPSMEAMGIEIIGLLERFDWKMYPIYRSIDAKQVPCGISVGIVFIK